MKNQEMIVLGLAGLAVYMIVKSQKGSAASVSPGSPLKAKPSNWVAEIFDMGDKSYTNGWRYFENGVAIDPSGNYYQDGAMVWQAPGAGA